MNVPNQTGLLTNIDVYKILQLGLTGLSFLCLFLAFLLIYKVITIKGNDDTFRQKSILSISFMVVSIVFLFGVYLARDQENKLTVIITPSQMPEGLKLPAMYHRNEIGLKDGKITINVRNDDQLTFEIYNFTKKIDELKTALQIQQADQNKRNVKKYH